MSRTNPRQPGDTIFRYREMYFKRLIQDSIVGVKGHWYFYNPDKSKVNYEDIYDGKRLVRINNVDSTALLYDLIKFPEFRNEHFWSHNTPYGMQYEFRHVLNNTGSYKIERLNDAIFMNTDCFQIAIHLNDKITMPGFATKRKNREGSVSKTLFIIDKQAYYPLRMKGESYSAENPEQRFFIDQIYYDIQFSMELAESIQFDSSSETISC